MKKMQIGTTPCCRICMRPTKPKDLTSLNDVDAEKVSYADKLKICGHVEVLYGVGLALRLPDVVCPGCISKLNKSYELYCNYRKSEVVRNVERNCHYDNKIVEELMSRPYAHCNTRIEMPMLRPKATTLNQCTQPSSQQPQPLNKLNKPLACAPPGFGDGKEVKKTEKVKSKCSYLRSLADRMPCEYCGRLFKNMHTITRHKRALHPNVL